MKRILNTSIVMAVAIALAWSMPAASSLAAAQRGVAGTAASANTATSSAIPRIDGHPDLSGVWWRGSDIGGRPAGGAPAGGRGGEPAGARGGGRGAAPPPSFTSLYQPWAQEKAKTLGDKDDPSLRCIPTSFGTLNVSLFGVGGVGQIVQTPKFVLLLTETYHGFKLVPTDGRPHRDDVPPAYRGESVGHWEGDTLVVDTTNYSDVPWMFAEGRVSFHSDALHIIERYRRVDAKTLEIEATVEDSKVLTASWTVPKQTLTLAPFDQIMDLNCSGLETQALMDAAAKENYGKK
jgi:hypothetical protein